MEWHKDFFITARQKLRHSKLIYWAAADIALLVRQFYSFIYYRIFIGGELLFCQTQMSAFIPIVE